MTTLTQAFKTVDGASTASDLFNGDKGKAQKVYRDLAKVLHPDHVPAAKLAKANEAFAKLSTLWAAYERGDTSSAFTSTVITTRKRAYVVGDLIAQGDIAGIYRATYREDDQTKSAALKMTRSPANGDLVENEARVLKHLADKADPTGLPYISQLLDSFKYRDATSNVDRPVNVLTPLDGFYSLTQVKAAYPDGLDIRDVMWMWKRLLIAIGHAHRAGVVHAAVVPDHVLIHPEQHGLCLVDWCYASIEEQPTSTTSLDPVSWQQITVEEPGGFSPLKAVVPKWKFLYPDDVLNKEVVSAKTDVAMASKTIATLFNAETPIRLARFAKAGWVAPHEDAWELMNELTDLAAEHFPRAFRPFSMEGR